MRTPPDELIDQIEQTRGLIESAPTRIELNHLGGWVPDGAGGRKRDPNGTKERERAYFFEGVAQPELYFLSETTSEVVGTYILIGMPDYDIRDGDWWEDQGVRYHVQFVHHDKSYQVKAEVVVRRGKSG